jgi:hypothetical protein
MSRWSRWLAGGSGLVLLLWAAGCGSGPAKGTISGQVLYDKKPLPFGQITFYTEDGSTARSASIIDGKYTIKDFPVGQAVITVRTVPPPQGQPKLPDPKLGLPPEGVSGQNPPPAVNRPYVPIPQRYGVREQSGLRYTVQPGEQTYNIELTP